MIDEKVLMEILDSREARARRQEELIDKYKKSLISFCLNIPGRLKDRELYRRIHRKGLEEIIKDLRERNIEIIYREELDKSTGREAFIVVDYEARRLKHLAIEIEEKHPLGRIFDIDIFDEEGRQISRGELGLPARKCLLCERDARICMRERRHSYEDLISHIESLGEKYL